MNGPLDGVRVLDFGAWQQGPVAASMLGDLGADVIKVEDRLTGDPVRGMMTITGLQSGTGHWTRNYVAEIYNRNKRGITLDLKKERGKQVVYKLVETADVFLHNWRKGVAERLGLDYGTLSRYNPGLIYAHSSGWGYEGPDSAEPAMDFTGMGRSGMMYTPGDRDMPPLTFTTGLVDQIGGIMLVQGILAALVGRERLGIGQEVDVSLLSSMLMWQYVPVSMRLLLSQEMPRRNRQEMNNPLWNHYKCADDKWIILAMLQPDRFWSAFCQALRVCELEHDARFENLEVRAQNKEALINILDSIFMTRPRDEWMKIFREYRLIYAPVQTISEVIEDPQVLANNYIVDFTHPEWGPIKVVAPPYKFSKTPATLRMPAPAFGQHTEEVLLECGFTWDEIAGLRKDEIT